jgi:hypothetical protein
MSAPSRTGAPTPALIRLAMGFQILLGRCAPSRSRRGPPTGSDHCSAFARRDASLFDQVYSDDCPCLKAGRDAIAALLMENVVWKGRSVSILVQSIQRINDQLWEVVAVFASRPFRIETEDGALIRRAPAERIRYRFLLFRPIGGEQWLLGNASVLKTSFHSLSLVWQDRRP